LLDFGPLKAPTGQLCRVFISHAGEQKLQVVDFLLQEFQRSYPTVEVFVDEFSLKVGDAALKEIVAALGDAFVGESIDVAPCTCAPQYAHPCLLYLLPWAASPCREATCSIVRLPPYDCTVCSYISSIYPSPHTCSLTEATGTPRSDLSSRWPQER
jgi:hypothetical protein